jgi:hypothetical protein
MRMGPPHRRLRAQGDRGDQERAFSEQIAETTEVFLICRKDGAPGSPDLPVSVLRELADLFEPLL